MSYIQIKDYNKIINKQDILTNINIELKKGLIYGIYGENGSGKTMFLRAVAGLIKADKGYVKVEEKVIREDISFPQSLGIIIESPGFWNHYTGFENLKILANIKQIINDTDIENALVRVGLNPRDKRVYKKYSLGMKQRLAVAQAIMEKPELLLLDEPTNALDEDGIKKIRKIILEEKERGATILMASHNKEDLEFLADELIYVSNGKVEQRGK